MNTILPDFSRVKIIFFDFDGVFTDNTVWTDQEGNESVRCWRSDGLGLLRLKDVGVEPFILSTEKNPVVSKRASKLNVACMQALEDKSDSIRKICIEKAVDLDSCAYLGNDINDISALKIVGLPIAVADAYDEIIKSVKYITKKAGGFGAVREVCDLIFNQKKI